MSAPKKRKTSNGHGVLKIHDGHPGIITFELGPMSGGFSDFKGALETAFNAQSRTALPPGLTKRARKTDIAAAALAQRDAALAEVDALRGINAALEGENRRAWAMVRKLAAEGGA